MVLVDSSVWIRHFRAPNRALLEMIRLRRAVVSAVVLGELMLGTLSIKEVTDVEALPQLAVPSARSVLEFLRRHASIRALGIGWADLELLASCAGSGAILYTADAALRVAAGRCGVRLVA